MIYFLLLLVALAVFAIALYCSQVALDRGRHPVVWFLFGLLLGPLALFAARRLPPKDTGSQNGNRSETGSILSFRRRQPHGKSAGQDAPDHLDESG